MVARFAKWFVVAALVLALGGHWAILQTAAWIGMTISYSQTGSLGTALSKTFDGKHPCKMCQLVRAGKAAEKNSETKLDTKKLDSLLASAFYFSFPPLRQFSVSRVDSLSSRINVPLSPPPRLA